MLRMSSFKSFLVSVIWLDLLALLTSAQYTGTATAAFPDSTDPASACSPGNIHHVSVGGAGFNFNPAVTYANPGDVVVFTFWPSNHSVVRTDYTGSGGSINPCVPIEVLQPGATGFFSGNKIIEADPTAGNVRTKDESHINVADTFTIGDHLEFDC
jgi:plastocyanin